MDPSPGARRVDGIPRRDPGEGLRGGRANSLPPPQRNHWCRPEVEQHHGLGHPPLPDETFGDGRPQDGEQRIAGAHCDPEECTALGIAPGIV